MVDNTPLTNEQEWNKLHLLLRENQFKYLDDGAHAQLQKQAADRQVQERQPIGGWHGNRHRGIDLQLNLQRTLTLPGCPHGEELGYPPLNLHHGLPGGPHLSLLPTPTAAAASSVNESVPGEVLPEEVVDKVLEREEGLVEEGEEWVATEDAEREDAPLLDADRR